MDKPILVTNIDGLLLKYEVFTEPHREWFQRAIEKTRDKNLEKWIGREDYFLGVNEAMQKILPNASKQEQTAQARKWYQEDVIDYIKNHPEKIKKSVAKKLKTLKSKYNLILLTTNSQDYINKILETANLTGIYDRIIASPTEEEPSKEKLLDELIVKYGTPRYYLTGKPKDKINAQIRDLGVQIITEDEMDEL